jgi:hypothetical protein
MIDKQFIEENLEELRSRMTHLMHLQCPPSIYESKEICEEHRAMVKLDQLAIRNITNAIRRKCL